MEQLHGTGASEGGSGDISEDDLSDDSDSESADELTGLARRMWEALERDTAELGPPAEKAEADGQIEIIAQDLKRLKEQYTRPAGQCLGQYVS